MAAGRPRHGLRDGAHSADRMPPGPLLPVHLAEGMMQQHIGGSRRIGAGIVPHDGVEAEPGLQRLAFEPAFEIVGGRFGEQIEERGQIFRGQSAKPVAQAPGFQYFTQGSRIEAAAEIRRRLQDELAQHIGVGVELPAEGAIAGGVGRAELRDVAFGLPFGSEKVPAIRRGEEVLRATLDNLQSMIVQAKVRDDLGIEQADRVGGDRVAEARDELLGDRRSAHHGAALDHLDAEPGHAEIGGAGQPVVARPDDDDVVALHRGRHSLRQTRGGSVNMDVS